MATDGSFALGDVPPGRYRVRVGAWVDRTWRESAAGIVDVVSGGTATVDLTE